MVTCKQNLKISHFLYELQVKECNFKAFFSKQPRELDCLFLAWCSGLGNEIL